jgi:hypothetical protein
MCGRLSHRTGQDTGSGLGSSRQGPSGGIGRGTRERTCPQSTNAMFIVASGNGGGRAKQSRHVGENMTLAFASFGKGDALDYSVCAQSEDTVEI